MKLGTKLLSIGLLLLSGVGFIAARNSSESKVQEVEAATVTYDYTTANTYHNNGNASSLLSTLRSLTSSGSAGSYSDLWNSYKTVYVKANGKMMDYYSSSSSFTPGTDQAGSYKAEGDVYNREHSIPKSWWGGSESNQGADLFIVVPTDGYVNNKRSNYPLGMVSSATYTSNGGFSKLGSAVSSWGYSGTVFEPDDSVKGDLARIVFYAVARYSASYGWTSGEGSSTFSGSASTNFGLTNYAVKLFTYWNNLDKPDDWERSVNDKGSSIQGNKNPFIDHPEYANTLWGSVSGATTYSDSQVGITSISKTSTSITVGNTDTISATSSNSGNISWSSNNTSVATVSPATTSSGNSTTITGVAAGTATITASITIDGQTYKKTCTVSVTSSGGGSGETTTTISSTPLTSSEISNGMTVAWGTTSSNLATGIDGDWVRLSTDSSSWITFTLTGSSSGFTLKNGNNYVYSSGAKKVSFSSSNSTSLLLDSTDDFVTSSSWVYVYNDNNGSGGIRPYTSAGSFVNTYLYEVTETAITKTLSSISVSGQTSTFTEGDGFSFGGTVTAHYSDNSTANVTTSATFSGYDLTETGSQTVTVSYKEGNTTKTTSYSITVNKGTLSSIGVYGQTLEYEQNSEFSFDGTCVATFANGYDKEVEPTNVTSPNMTTTGSKTITITYTYNNVSKTTSYTITVTEASGSANHGLEPTDPLDVSEAITICESVGEDATTVLYYTQGIVSQITTAYNSTYGNISFKISSDGQTSGDQLLAFRCKYLEGADFTSADQLSVGDEVIIVGYLFKYNSTTPEYAAGCNVHEFVSGGSQGGGNSGSVSLTQTMSTLYASDTTDLGTIAFYSNNSETITGAFATGSGNNNPKYFSNGSAVRMYPNNTLTITSTKANLTSVVFTFGSGDSSNSITPSTGSYSNGTWETANGTTTVTFTIGGTKDNRRIASITVTYFGAVDYATYFNANIGCNINGTSAPTGDWTTMTNKFNTLFKAEQDTLKDADYTTSGSGSQTVVTPGDGVSQAVANCVSKYDIIVRRYHYTNFMSRSNLSSNSVTSLIPNTDSNTTSIIVIVVSLLSITALGGFLFIKHRKEV